MENSNNVVWHRATVTRRRREQLNGHRAVIIWLTGLSGSGKSTLAHAVEEQLHRRGCRSYVFDGDNVRHGLCADLGFSHEDRAENIRRIGEMAKLFVDAGLIVLAAFISPFQADRDRLRRSVVESDFLEVYCRCDLSVCESRDTKGLYRRARAGEVRNFTGISAPYEAPVHPELILDTDKTSLEECVASVLDLLARRGVISETGSSERP
ncbi:MAG TPA: adenylyl-sulfate kinase [Acidiferrobacterales bacterium]|jgi:adenylylsulfate kinase